MTLLLHPNKIVYISNNWKKFDRTKRYFNLILKVMRNFVLAQNTLTAI